MDSFYIGIDVGTGSARACIVDESGEIKALANQDIKTWMPETGYYEQSTSDIWKAICSSVKSAISSNPNISPCQVRGIGIAATCSLAVFDSSSRGEIDDPNPVAITGPDFKNDGDDRNVILWLDHRAVTETEKINSTGSNILLYVGNKMSVEMEIPKILWLKNHMPAGLFARCKFFDLADALTYLATGRETRSLCSTVCKQSYLPAGLETGTDEGWQGEFFEHIGLEEFVNNDFEMLGGADQQKRAFLSAGEFVGTLSERAASDLGLPAGIAVGSGIIDAYAGWVGTIGTKIQLDSSSPDSADDKGIEAAFTRLASVAGTSTCHLAMSPEPVFVDGVWGPYRDVLTPSHFLAEGGQSATGELLKHVLETHPAFQEVTNLAGSRSIYEFLNEHLQSMGKDEKTRSVSYLGRHRFLYGDLWGNRSPLGDPMMTGACIGLNSDRSVSGLALDYYSALEFIALQTRQIVESMNSAGHKIKSIFMSGSQCQNKILMCLISVTCNMPVIIPKYETAAVVHGAAMLGVKAATAGDENDWKGEGLWSIMQRMSQPGKLIIPENDESLRKLLQAKYEVFLDMSKTQTRYRKHVNEVTEGWK